MTDITLTVTVTPEKAAEIVAILDGPALETKARDEARKLHEEKRDDKTAPAEPPYDPDARIYGKPGEKSRRTKDEIAFDEDIAARWAALWPSKDVPEKPVGELVDTIAKVEAAETPADDEDGFSIDEDEDDADAADPMDLDEFRAIIVKHAKTLGNEALGKIMAPHKNPGQVPEDERRAYADRIVEAAGAA